MAVVTRDNITLLNVVNPIIKDTRRNILHCDGRIQADLQRDEPRNFSVAWTCTICGTTEKQSLARRGWCRGLVLKNPR